MSLIIVKALYLVLPAYLANMAPVIFAKLGWLKFFADPVDNHKQLGSTAVLGSGKTWRGILSAVIFGILIAGIQAWLFRYSFFQELSLFYYPKLFILFGLLAGLGAIVGDMVKSFLKRRVGIPSGRPWPGLDQLDFVIGFLVFTYWLVRPEWGIVIIILLLTLILHPIVNILGYLLGVKKVYW